jgi:hypothetical protein
MTMGTASTMMAIAEALGLTLPGASSIPAPTRHARMATRCGRRIVDMVWEDLKPRDILTRAVLRQRHHRAHGAGRLDQRASSTSSPWPAAPGSTCRSSASTSSRARTPVLANVRPRAST